MKLLKGYFFNLCSALLVVVFGCGSSDVQSEGKGYSIQGTMKNGGVQTVVFHEIKNTGLVQIDSARTNEKGEFRFSGSLDEETFCLLTFSDGKGLPLLVKNSDKIKLEIEPGKILDYKVSGSKGSEDLLKIVKINNESLLKSMELEKRAGQLTPGSASDSIIAVLREEYNVIQANRVDKLISFMANTESSLAPYFAVTFLEVPDIEFSVYEKVVKNMEAYNPKSKYVADLKAKVSMMRPTAIGSSAGEITLNDPSGNPVSISSLKGKYVLIDFWASWCRPCRAENPNNLNLYNKYKSQGFEIYGISIDDDKEAWKQAIKKDGLTWINVIDNKTPTSPSAVFNVQSIPFTVLLDKDGKIIAKGLRGEGLAAKLAEIFTK